jgi:hypothetical protein
MDFAQFYQRGGVVMHPILVVGILSALTGLMAFRARRRPIGVVAVGCGLLCIGFGYGAYALGMVEVEAALRTVAPDQLALAREAGVGAALIPLKFGAACGLPGLLGGLFALVPSRGPRV